MQRNTRIIGYIVSANLEAWPHRDVFRKVVADAVEEHGLPTIEASDYSDGSICIDITVEATPEFHADHYDFAEKLARVLADPELEGLDYQGQFTMVTDGLPLPTIMHVGVHKSKVYASMGSINWREQVPVEIENAFTGLAR